MLPKVAPTAIDRYARVVRALCGAAYVLYRARVLYDVQVQQGACTQNAAGMCRLVFVLVISLSQSDLQFPRPFHDRRARVLQALSESASSLALVPNAQVELAHLLLARHNGIIGGRAGGDCLRGHMRDELEEALA